MDNIQRFGLQWGENMVEENNFNSGDCYLIFVKAGVRAEIGGQ